MGTSHILESHCITTTLRFALRLPSKFNKLPVVSFENKSWELTGTEGTRGESSDEYTPSYFQSYFHSRKLDT